jgi:phosphoglycerate dehydrogenase-like enzyme
LPTRRQLLTSAAAGALSLATTRVSAGEAYDAPRLPMTILDRAGLFPQHHKSISELSPQITIARDADVADANVIFGGIDSADLSRAKKLRWVQYSAAGVESICYPEFVASDVVLTNAQGCYAPEIAEHVFGLLFSLTRHVAMHVRKHKWTNEPNEPIELRGMTIGIIGLGGIGRETARRAKAMDMRVLAVDAEPLYGERFAMADEVRLVDDGLEPMLARSDVVVMAAPHTAKSRGMLGEKQFAAMKRGAWFINVSRGKTTKTDALVAALKSGAISGAGLDVTDPEPLPDAHELWSMPNVVITPHIAGQSQFGHERMQNVFVENVRRWIANQPMLNIVDKAKGY